MQKLRHLLELSYESDINLAIWGTHGVGKTAIVNQFAQDKGAHLEVFILSQTDPLTLAGYPGRSHDEKDRIVMDTACPDWIVRLQDAAGAWNEKEQRSENPTVLFLDEFNRSDRFAQNAAMTLVLDKRVNGHELPKDTFIVVAMNPETDGDLGVNPLTDPMIDRFCHIGVGGTEAGLAKGFMDYGKKTNVNAHVTDFIHQNKEMITGWTLNFDEAIGNRLNPTPRSWESVGRIMDALTTEDEDGNLELDKKRLTSIGADLIAGLIGKQNVGTYIKFVSNNFVKPFTAAEVLKGDEKVLKRVAELKERNHTQVLVATLEKFHAEVATKKIKPEKLTKGWIPGDLENSTGFCAFVLACPVDVQGAFWNIINDDTQYWSSIMNKLPLEICSTLTS